MKMTIIQKQKQLQFLGYYKGKIDGIWGAQSEAATKAFQQANGLTVDGKFGAKTEAKTMQLVIDIQRAIGANVDGLVGSETIAKYNAYKNEKKEIAPDNSDFWSGIKHFNRSEFACKCGRYCNGFPVEPDRELVKLLDQIRAHYGKPARVNSGIRCKTHNKNVGGASNSQHLYGTAADLYIEGVSPSNLYSYVQTLIPNTGGIGLYSWGCHIDVRATKARWNG
jgi:uncharacterized protein YcbK (DUF882 family)